MKNNELREVFTSKEFDSLIGAEFTMVLVENLDKIEAKLKQLDAINKPSEYFIKFTEIKDKLFVKYADKGEDGKVLYNKNDDGQSTMSISDTKLFESYKKELDGLLKEYKETIDIQVKKDEELLKVIDLDCGIEFIKIDKSKLPKELVKITTDDGNIITKLLDINVRQIKLLKFMIN